jgi:redox-sensitive bicupin YhaK (pirin superfamily)
MSARAIVDKHQARSTVDGAGVKLRRVFGGSRPERFDPFLMMDEFGSESADDYIGGFPSHPHRGFQTITYMLEGKMEHRDHMGNVGLLQDGGVQWMMAGRGVIHSEMPQQTNGRMRGFQFWLNLPSQKKMQPAHYEDVPGNKIPDYNLDGVYVKAISGRATINGHEMSGYVHVPETQPVIFDLHIAASAHAQVHLPESQSVCVYAYEGTAIIEPHDEQLPTHTMACLGQGGLFTVSNRSDTLARVIVLSGKALKEPIVQYGPFVMNTEEEIDQALRDYREGTLTQAHL